MDRKIGLFWSTRSIVVVIISGLLISLLHLTINAVSRTEERDLLTISVSGHLSSQSIPIAVLAGNHFELTLPSNKTTGYSWQLFKTPDSRVLKFLNSRYNKPEKQMLGTGRSETWSFQAIGKGNVKITMHYVRKFEKDTAPAKIQSFSVTVQ